MQMHVSDVGEVHVKTKVLLCQLVRRILTGNWQRLAVLQQLPRYQEYLALGDEVCVALSFQYYYTIKFGSHPKDLD